MSTVLAMSCDACPTGAPLPEVMTTYYVGAVSYIKDNDVYLHEPISATDAEPLVTQLCPTHSAELTVQLLAHCRQEDLPDFDFEE